MSCAVCGGTAENIGTSAEPILVHRDLGAVWDGGYHAFRSRGRQPQVLAIERAFKVWVDGELVYPFTVPEPAEEPEAPEEDDA